MSFRTDRNNNPTAMTIDIAREGGLILDKDYRMGDSFDEDNHTYYTAYLLGDPVRLTVEVINNIGFYTHQGVQRWIYIGMPQWVWNSLSYLDKVKVVAFMYGHEGGEELKPLFAPKPLPLSIKVGDSLNMSDKVS